MTLTSNGNVGIGTGTTLDTQAKLHVKGEILSEGTGGIKTIMDWDEQNTSGWIGTRSDHNLKIGTNGSARMMITKGGNIGIGSFSGTGWTPNAPLQLQNIIQNRKIVLWESENNDHQFYGFGINNSVLRYQTSSTNADHVFFAGTSSIASNELMRIKGTGNVGIGTTSPTNKLHIKTTDPYDGIVVSTENINAPGGLYFNYGTNPAPVAGIQSARSLSGLYNDGLQLLASNGRPIQFHTRGSNSGPYLSDTQEVMRVNGNGNVGIGITTPTEKLHVNGTIKSNKMSYVKPPFSPSKVVKK